MKIVQILFTIIALVLAAPAALAQPANPWGGPPPKRSTPAAAQPAQPAQPAATGTRRVIIKKPKEEDEKEEPECQFGKDDKGVCLTWEQALTAHDAEVAAKARENAWLFACIGLLAIAILFFLGAVRTNAATRRAIAKIKAALRKFDERLCALEGRDVPKLPPPPRSSSDDDDEEEEGDEEDED